MAVNQSHSEDRRRPAIPHGESLLMECTDVDLSFPQQPQSSSLFSGTKSGTLFLTSYRVIFLTSHSVNDPMLSFMMPFHLMKNCTVEQPVFGANYIKGTILAAPDGGWEGQATFKLVFRGGGAIDFSRVMAEAASAASRGAPLGTTGYQLGPIRIYIIARDESVYPPQTPAMHCGAPPPGYAAPPPGYGAPPPGYAAPPSGYAPLPAGYEVPPPGYAAPPSGYAPLPAGYTAPPPGYAPLPAGYEVPPPGYAPLPAGYTAPPPGYAPLPSGYAVPPPENATPPAGYGGQSSRFEAPPAGDGASPGVSGATHPLDLQMAPPNLAAQRPD
ncbi:postacrosomal sheath WW domain-binding protein [Ochotona curzoniae]|uniref:postacrosomal sheath WW domain-binding protein n=1 Tax=Ochotona curzoniae TaxID=130825 RepID=UPI001B353F0C|nr:postacrosomal sheath WW domain-binding protein [Ochotona curzoniae]